MGMPDVLQWDPINSNACCATSGCIHPAAYNFDLRGYHKGHGPNSNQHDANNPIYVGIGSQHSGTINWNEGGEACTTCTKVGSTLKPQYEFYELFDGVKPRVINGYAPKDYGGGTTTSDTTDPNFNPWHWHNEAHGCCKFVDHGPLGCTDPNACHNNLPAFGQQANFLPLLFTPVLNALAHAWTNDVQTGETGNYGCCYATYGSCASCHPLNPGPL